MKQFFTFALALAAAASVNVNAESARQGYVLTKIEEPTFAETKEYTWDAEKLQVTRVDSDGEDTFYTLFNYDEEGRTIEESAYQFFYFDNSDDGEYLHTSTCRSEYDDQGRLSLFWVINYNALYAPEEPFSIAVMVFTYDDKGLLTTIETSFCNSLDDPQSKWRPSLLTTYEYNEQGQRVRALYDVYGIGEDKSLRRNSVQVFTYDGKGRLVVTRDEDGSGIVYSNKVYVYDGDRLDNVFLTGSSFRYEIDENGDLKINNEGNPTKRQEFVYDDEVPAENVAYPCMSIYDQQIGDNTMFLLKDQVIMETVYERPQEDGATLEVYSELEYTWDLVKSDKFPELEVGIESIAAPTNFFRAAVEGNELVVKGNPSDYVSIYDLNGRLMQRSLTVNGKVNVSDLESGVYVVTSGAVAAKVIR